MLGVFLRTENSHLNNLCPFWSLPGIQVGILGVTPANIALDTLHTVDLGVTQHYIGHTLNLIMLCDADVLRTGFDMQISGMLVNAMFGIHPSSSSPAPSLMLPHCDPPHPCSLGINFAF